MSTEANHDRFEELLGQLVDGDLSRDEVAELVLMEEPVGLAELDGDLLAGADESTGVAMDAAMLDDVLPTEAGASGPQILATLEQWLQYLEGTRAGRAQ